MEVVQLSDNGTAEDCTLEVVSNLHYLSAALAGAILVLYSFTQRRVRLWPACCSGLPGIVIPLDLVHTSPHQAVYVLIFGAITGEIFTSIFTPDGQYNISASTPLQYVATTILVLFLQSLTYFPVFASVDAPIPVMGYAIGFLFTLWLLIYEILVAVSVSQECPDVVFSSYSQDANFVLAVLFLLPIKICQFLVDCWFLWRLVWESIKLLKTKNLQKALFEHQHTTYHIRHVRSLLKKPEVEEENRKVVKFGKKAISLFYEPYSQYPLPFLASLLVMVIMLYLLTLTFLNFALELTLPMVNVVEDARDTVFEIAAFVEGGGEITLLSITYNGSAATASSIRTTYDIVHDTAYGITVIFPIAPLFAFVWNLVLLVHMVTAVHGHLKRIARGDLSFLPHTLPSPAYRLLGTMRYAGYQIAYFVWAWIIMMLMVWVVGALGLLLYFLLKYLPKPTITTLSALLVPLLYSSLLYYVQLIMCKLFFVGDTKNKHTVLKNRHLFHWFTYVLFFQNVVVGLTSALLRIFYSLCFGLLLLFRLDRVVLMEGFEDWDPGYKTYVAFLYLEHTQNNSVLNVFVSLLVEAVKGGGGRRELSGELSPIVEEESNGERPRVSRRALNRWLVAYTLLRNQSLGDLTGSRLAEQRERERDTATPSLAEQRERERDTATPSLEEASLERNRNDVTLQTEVSLTREETSAQVSLTENSENNGGEIPLDEMPIAMETQEVPPDMNPVAKVTEV